MSKFPQHHMAPPELRTMAPGVVWEWEPPGPRSRQPACCRSPSPRPHLAGHRDAGGSGEVQGWASLRGVKGRRQQ